MFGVVVKQPVLARCSHVLDALDHVGGGGVTEYPAGHILHLAGQAEPATAGLSVLKLLALPVLLEPE